MNGFARHLQAALNLYSRTYRCHKRGRGKLVNRRLRSRRPGVEIRRPDQLRQKTGFVEGMTGIGDEPELRFGQARCRSQADFIGVAIS